MRCIELIVFFVVLLVADIPLAPLLAAEAPYSACFEAAGRRYGISPKLLRCIAEIESGMNPAAVHRNQNGSYDYGIMQINSQWEKIIGRQRWMSLGEPCYNIHVGAWILADCIRRHGYSWEAVGCYNATDGEKRRVYARKVMRTLLDAANAKTESKGN
ncbi:MAG: lytic transglycosylase domain-containing protein [Syntrophales bacterium]